MLYKFIVYLTQSRFFKKGESSKIMVVNLIIQLNGVDLTDILMSAHILAML